MNKMKKIIKLSPIFPIVFSPVFIAISCNKQTREEKETELKNLYDQFMNKILTFVPLLGNNLQSLFNSMSELNNKDEFTKEIAKYDDEKLDALIKVLKDSIAVLNGKEVADPVFTSEKQEELASLIDQMVEKMKTQIANMPDPLKETIGLSLKNFTIIKLIIPLMNDEQINTILPTLKQQLSIFLNEN
ncbi:hypothetical protein [Mycoplasmopsis gallinarum]|uniref:hypothetical protein n=1 Tax=Mycoplasmopsis gallinarum TaxID=29557 RepID=UPI000485E3A0|nr:hypothetical protein [Mycoplasmopsis gallinarum]